tara:strand:- start:4015 stop:4533 length:519 start_codon:yes stop_codon:yes gene_type:complete
MENITYLALTELLISIVIGVTLLYLTFSIINKFIRRKNGIKYNNISFAIFTSSIIFSVGYLLADIKSPILNTLRLLRENPDYAGNIYVDGFKYGILFIIIIIASIYLVNVLSFYLFSMMTKTLNEFDEIKKDNIAVAIISSVIIIAVSLMLKDSLYFLLDTFVPYPDAPSLN